MVNGSAIKAELLSKYEREWASIERMCASLGEAQMVAPVQGEWSMKDILAHISAWEKFLLDRMGYVMTGHHPQYPALQTEEDVRRFNARVYSENKDRPLTSVILESRNLYQGVVTVIEALTDEQLSQPYSYDFVNDHMTVHDLVRVNTYGHYAEHFTPELKR